VFLSGRGIALAALRGTPTPAPARFSMKLVRGASPKHHQIAMDDAAMAKNPMLIFFAARPEKNQYASGCGSSALRGTQGIA
jgi:hypothetical protein